MYTLLPAYTADIHAIECSDALASTVKGELSHNNFFSIHTGNNLVTTREQGCIVVVTSLWRP